ncbi:hypothetical protein [Bacillus weihaiensis]|uniref:hypothetical protein n=1 Tax=Bacillus weihaiensis TaxID=1547283 RepID=UPI002352AEDB|nr:hypothetical protein [Bacillus weihaiensis]
MKKEVDSMELPNTKAFQDEFTRSLLDSPEEVEEGYYLFKSDTGGYSMLWPKDAVTDGPPFYQRTQDGFEKIIFDEIDEEKNYHYSFSTTYSTYGDKVLDSSLSLLSSSIGYKGDYEKIETNKTFIYYGKSQKKLNTENRSTTSYRFFSYIVSKESQKGLEFVYIAKCLDEKSTKCNLNVEEEEKKALRYMRYVSFNKD